jgi:flagellar assembly protein FliH
MPMSAARKFLFDISFDAPVTEPPQAAPDAAPADPSAAALETARAEGFAEGKEVGLMEAAARDERRLGEAVERLASGVADLVADTARQAAAHEREAAQLAATIARKLVPELARRHGLGEIEALVIECLRSVQAEPRLVLRVPEVLFGPAKERLSDLTDAAGYGGKVVLLADAALAATDCRVEWADGGIERDCERTWRDIDAAISRALDTITASLSSGDQA